MTAWSADVIEDNIGTAIKSFTDADPILGSVIILLLISNVVTARFLLAIVRELKADLSAERTAHQKTRDAQMDDLRNHGRLAESINALRDLVMRKA